MHNSPKRQSEANGQSCVAQDNDSVEDRLALEPLNHMLPSTGECGCQSNFIDGWQSYLERQHLRGPNAAF
jgi:hypothetical protein